jgi:hypothetical protein
VKRLIAIAVIVSATALSAQKQTLSEQDKADAVRIGTKEKGKLTGLSLLDSGASWANALTVTAANPSGTGGTGFSLRVYTPKTWVEQLASNAAKEYRPFTINDITDEMLEPVLRVIVYPDKPTSLTAAGMASTSSAEHVVLRDEAKHLVVQPASKEAFSDKASSALRDMEYQGLVAKFPLDSLKELRGPNGDKEFLIVVVGAKTKEKEFRVKQKHFERLP